jgi:hypothetical protein
MKGFQSNHLKLFQGNRRKIQDTSSDEVGGIQGSDVFIEKKFTGSMCSLAVVCVGTNFLRWDWSYL